MPCSQFMPIHGAHWNDHRAEDNSIHSDILSILLFRGKSDYSPAGVGGLGRGGRGAAGLTAVDDAGLAAGRAAGREVGRAWGFATLKDLIFR